MPTRARFLGHCLLTFVVSFIAVGPLCAQSVSNAPPPVLGERQAPDEAPDDLNLDSEVDVDRDVRPKPAPASDPDLVPSPASPIQDAQKEDEAATRPLKPDARPVDFMTPIWSTVGCALCGALPFLAAAGLVGLAVALVLSGVAQGGCGGVIGIIAGVLVAILALFPAALGGLTAPGGSAVATGISRWANDRPVLWPTLASLIGMLPGLAAVAALGLSGAALVVFSENEPPEGVFIGMMLGVVAAVAFSLLGGPLAVVAGAVTAAVVDTAEAEASPASGSSATPPGPPSMRTGYAAAGGRRRAMFY